jgi:hypothetical protein
MARLLWTGPVGAGLIFIFASSVARSEPSAAELASARDLFAEARRAEENGQWSEALSKLNAVANVKMTPQVRFHLGLCQEHMGQLVEALNSFERAKSEAAEQNLPIVVDEAKEHTASVRARLPKLLIVLPAGTADAKVEVDGQIVASVLLSRPLPFDPGQHKIVATAPGRVFSREVTVAEKEERQVDVVFSSAPVSVAPNPADAAASAATASATPRTRAPASDERSAGASSRGSPMLGWVAVGAGGVALVGASVSFIVRQNALSHIDDVCPTHQGCPRSLEDSQTKARTFGALGLALGVVGGASVITGVVLLVKQHSETTTAAGFRVTPWMSAGAAGAVGAMSW